LTDILPVVFFAIAMCIVLAAYFSDRWAKKEEEKFMTPEEFYADCDGDAVKMIDKFLVDYNRRTFGELFYMQKQVIEEQRRLLEQIKDERK